MNNSRPATQSSPPRRALMLESAIKQSNLKAEWAGSRAPLIYIRGRLYYDVRIRPKIACTHGPGYSSSKGLGPFAYPLTVNKSYVRCSRRDSAPLRGRSPFGRAPPIEAAKRAIARYGESTLARTAACPVLYSPRTAARAIAERRDRGYFGRRRSVLAAGKLPI